MWNVKHKMEKHNAESSNRAIMECIKITMKYDETGTNSVERKIKNSKLKLSPASASPQRFDASPWSCLDLNVKLHYDDNSIDNSIDWVRSDSAMHWKQDMHMQFVGATTPSSCRELSSTTQTQYCACQWVILCKSHLPMASSHLRATSAKQIFHASN